MELEHARKLLLKPVLSFEDRATLARILAVNLNELITPANIFETQSDMKFMRRYFPKDRYVQSPHPNLGHVLNLGGALARHGHSIASLCMGDVKSTLVEAVYGISSPGIIDRIAGRPAPRPSQLEKVAPTVVSDDPSADARAADRAEIRTLTLRRASMSPREKARLLALLRSRYRGAVDESNYITICLEFLRKYYPEDFERERAFAARRTVLTGAPDAHKMTDDGTTDRSPHLPISRPAPPAGSARPSAAAPLAVSRQASTAAQAATQSASASGGRGGPLSRGP